MKVPRYAGIGTFARLPRLQDVARCDVAVVGVPFDAGTTFGSGVGDFKDGYTSGNLRKMVEKGLLKMDDIVEIWKSPLIPNGPLVVHKSVSPEVKAKLTDYFMNLPTTDKPCFAAMEGGEYKGYVKVTPEFYQPIIDARKTKVGS